MGPEQKPPRPPAFAAPAAGALKGRQANHYILDRTNEDFSRTILDLILVDRLNSLGDKNAYHRFLLCGEVSRSIKTVDEFGRCQVPSIQEYSKRD